MKSNKVLFILGLLLVVMLQNAGIVEAIRINIIPPPSPSPPPTVAVAVIGIIICLLTQETTICKDEDTAPEAPRNLRITDTQSDTIQACFDPPQYPSSCPSRYDVRYNIIQPTPLLGAAARGSAEALASVELPPGLSLGEGGCFTLENLMAGTKYDLEVQSIREQQANDIQGGTAQTTYTTAS